MRVRQFTGVSTLALLIAAPSAVHADAVAIDYIDIERIQVVGKHTDRANIPGAATRLSEEDLELFKYQDIMRTLRMVPGVNIQEEDGFGLRPNIGLRGSGVERSSKITLMEDGVLIAPAPYAAPAAYYFPTAARMQAVEVRKGSAAVKFGPRSVGGAINLVSRSIPDDFAGFFDARIGSDNLFTTHGSLGASGDHVGGMVEFFSSSSDGFKKLPGGEETGYEIEDYLGKFRIKTDANAEIQQSLTLKLSKTNNDSDETYLGLSDSDFAASPYSRYAASALDHMDTSHEQIQLTHQIKLGDVEVVTTAYKNSFERDWFKFNDLQASTDSCGSTSGAFVLANEGICATELAWLKGTQDSPEGAIRLRHNARAYDAKGIQSLVAIPFVTGDASHDLEMSVRYHEDSEDRLQNNETYTMVNGSLIFENETALGSAGNRLVEAEAWAFFAQDTISYGNWTIVPGIRFESIKLNRTDWAGSDPSRAGTATTRPEADIDAVIPGLGVTYKLTDQLTLTGGIFKGFNPPGAGNADTQEEKSLNIEAGALYDQNGFFAEGIVFFSDYNNIHGDCTASSGQPGDCEIGDQFNGGAARIFGLELSGGYTALLGGEWSAPIRFNYTFTDAEFRTSFEDSFWGSVVRGDEFPYLSRHQFTVSAGVQNDVFSTTLQVNYVSASRAEAGTGTIAETNRIDGRFVADLAAHYRLTDNLQLFASVDNLFDETYSVARRPMGLRPGKPRTIIGGAKFTF
ncbi:TonB-dependent receptor family protein [Kordiimonas sp.]|uniref:TonB-dependent receptor family protein n=1 Tax=Kordiimonas sp. TaxID=1970157 RepID=UPI003A902059